MPKKEAPEATPKRKRTPTEHMKKLGPKVRKLASFVGLPADTPELALYITKELKQKAPGTVTDRSDDPGVTALAAGVEMSFSHKILNDAYPVIHKTAKTYVPYLTTVWVREKIGETVMGLSWKADAKEGIETLGQPTQMKGITVVDKPAVPSWIYDLDTGADVELDITIRKGVSVILSVKSAMSLTEHPNVSTGLFVAWCATNGLLNAARFPEHAKLVADLQARKIKGSDFIKAALPRGLWGDHLIDNKELQMKAYLYFHNMKGLWITADLKTLFGKREGPHGHDEPKLDEDTWAAVDKAAKIFRGHFGEWIPT